MSWFSKQLKKISSSINNDIKKVETAASNDFHKVVNAVKNGETAISHGVRNTVGKIGRTFTKLSQDLESVALLPLVPPMQLLMKNHGQPYEGKTFDIAQRFYNYFIAGNAQNFESFDDKNTAGGTAGAVALGAAGQAVGIPAPVGAALGKIVGTLDEKGIKLIVGAILKFFKKHKNSGSFVDAAVIATAPVSNAIVSITNGTPTGRTNLITDAANGIIDNHFSPLPYQNMFHG